MGPDTFSRLGPLLAGSSYRQLIGVTVRSCHKSSYSKNSKLNNTNSG